MSKKPASTPSLFGSVPLALLRIAIGWHFLYEGVVKFLDLEWTAAGFLKGTESFMSGFFHYLASSPALMRAVDLLNEWGLILIGFCLLLGIMTRFAAVCGIGLLSLYYLAYPPFFAELPVGVTEGHYLVVNKTLVELLALCVVLVYPAKMFGLDPLLAGLLRWKRKRAAAQAAKAGEVPAVVPPQPFSRRQVLACLTGIPIAGAFALALLRKRGWISHEEEQLAAAINPAGALKPDAVAQPSKTFNWTSLEELKGKIPQAKILDLEVSRVILGGNLIGGWAHARDLIYVSKLIKAYHHRYKIFETLRLAEECGINTILTNPILCDAISDYWQNGGGKIQFISDCGGQEVVAMTQKSIDNGASACYIQGGTADKLVKEEKFDLIEEVLELVRKNGLPAGIGGHHLATIQACVERDLKPDFWMKTLHHTDYWSATPTEEKDNIWCEQPDETIAYMRGREEPWIAFKTLAAGAIHPKVGFRFAFENGADFVCVGMYDFQIVEDANLALDVLGGKLKRDRPWYA